MIKPIELLMPAGDFEKMRFAIAFGADAVYLGIPQFSLRARENGFRQHETVVEAIEYAHAHGKKVYLTANIFAHNHKVDSFVKYVTGLLSQSRPDGWIISDPGLIMLMKENFPKEILHLSVQANTVNYASAQFWRKLDIRRIILSRELSIKEINVIRQNCPDLELEVFVHGAICIAYSGRCLISNYMSHRDANQGTCTNSCRWEYKISQNTPLKGDYYLEEKERPAELMPIDEDEHGTYLMNAKDLCAIEYLKELYEAGVDSFKVEGRSKSVYYVALIARAYRQAIDNMLAGKEFNQELLKDIQSTSNRGLMAGFLKGNPGHTALNYNDGKSTYSYARFSGIVRGFDEARKLIKVECKNPIHTGMTLEMLFQNETQKLEINKIFNGQGIEIPKAHGGSGNCWIPYPHDPGEFVLLRERLDKTADSS